MKAKALDAMPTRGKGKTAVAAWASAAAPGERYVYATTGTGFTPRNPEVAAAWTLHLGGAVLLAQRRVRANGRPTRTIEYLAIRSSR